MSRSLFTPNQFLIKQQFPRILGMIKDAQYLLLHQLFLVTKCLLVMECKSFPYLRSFFVINLFPIQILLMIIFILLILPLIVLKNMQIWYYYFYLFRYKIKSLIVKRRDGFILSKSFNCSIKAVPYRCLAFSIFSSKNGKSNSNYLYYFLSNNNKIKIFN